MSYVFPFKLTPPRLVALGAAVLFVAWCIGSGISLALSQSELQAAWQHLETVESGRAAAINAWEGAADSVAAFEPEVFQAADQARQAWVDASTVTERVAAIHELDAAQNQLRAKLQTYAELQREAAYRQAQAALADATTAAEGVRLEYDEAVQLFNVRLLVFPRNLIAWLFGIEPAPRFQFVESSPSA